MWGQLSQCDEGVNIDYVFTLGGRGGGRGGYQGNYDTGPPEEVIGKLFLFICTTALSSFLDLLVSVSNHSDILYNYCPVQCDVAVLRNWVICVSHHLLMCSLVVAAVSVIVLFFLLFCIVSTHLLKYVRLYY